jgi:isopentenyl-diphosphate delta-isomerase
MQMTDNSNQKVILVNDNDEPIGEIDKITAHKQAMLHRAFSVFLIRLHKNNYECLLQQRAANKYHSGGLWSNTCCSHPRPNEDITNAAKRRLQEELGISISKLEKLNYFIYKAELDNEFYEHELDHLLIGELNQETNFLLDLNEVQNIKWITFTELQQQLINNPQNYTVWLSLALAELKRARPKLFQIA